MRGYYDPVTGMWYRTATYITAPTGSIPVDELELVRRPGRRTLSNGAEDLTPDPSPCDGEGRTTTPRVER